MFGWIRLNYPETVTKYIYLSNVLKYTFEYLYFTWVLCLLKTFYFNFTTFERQILYFSLQYISINVF